MSTTEYTTYRTGKTKEIERLELQAKSLCDTLDKEIQILNIRSGTKVLDAGCGMGSFARKIASTVAPAQVTAIDIDSVFIEMAKKFAINEGKTNIHFEIADIQNLDLYRDEIFDVVYCSLVIPHLGNPSKAISELKRVTKKDGLVAAFDEGDMFTYPPIDKFFGLFFKVARWRKETLEQSTPKKITASELFKSLGLEDAEIFPIPDFASYTENREKLNDLANAPLQMLEMYKDEVISKGFMSESDYNEGVKELNSWLERPDAFWMVLNILTIGKV